jgi:hypothetical protein
MAMSACAELELSVSRIITPALAQSSVCVSLTTCAVIVPSPVRG